MPSDSSKLMYVTIVCSFFFWVVFHCMNISLFVYPFAFWQIFDYFQLLAFTNKFIWIFMYRFFQKIYLFIFEREGETESEWRRHRERGRHRIQSRPQAPNCQHRARCRARTHKPWDHDLSQSWLLNQLSHPGTPHFIFLQAYDIIVQVNVEQSWISFF